MGKQVDWNDIPDSRQSGDLPDGIYMFSVESIVCKPSGSGKLMYESILRVVEPATFAGAPLYENFVIGSDTDPQADDPHTLRDSVGLKILKTIFVVCGMPLSRDLDVMTQQAAGQRFLASIFTKPEPAMNKDGTANQYAGRKKNVMGRLWRVGERAVGLTSTPPAASVAAPVPNNGGGQTIKSPFTGEEVPVAEFAAHVAAQSKK